MIDQIFGGQALAGKKTMLSVVRLRHSRHSASARRPERQPEPEQPPPGEILTTLIGGFGALGGLAKSTA